HCGTMAEVEAALRRMRPQRGFGPKTSEQPAHQQEAKRSSPPIQPVERPPESEPPLAEVFQEPEPTAPSPPPLGAPRRGAPPPEPGKGGSQHKYVQQLIKRLAEDRGLRAVIEEAVEGGHVDVGLHHGDLSVACEISVTSTAEYEAKNLAKCIRAGFTRVWAVSPDTKRRKVIMQAAEARLGAENFAKIEFLTTEEVVDAIEALILPEPTEKIVAGYKVKTTWKPVSPAEAKARRATIARILANAMRRTGG
ncbi:MAG TPA: hypothetical protein VG960_11100, partial [Caulobacteraceae bacterium]|nr:hypothetical protein [Caulobacteraceae bacterium]